MRATPLTVARNYLQLPCDKAAERRGGASLLKTEEHGRGPSKAGALRLCLAGSGGGHVRQILDLEPAWSGHDYFFLTEDTALGKSLALQHRTHFVPHFA